MSLLEKAKNLLSRFKSSEWIACVTSNIYNSYPESPEYYASEITRKLSETPDDPIFSEVQYALKVSDNCYVIYAPSMEPKILNIGRKRLPVPIIVPIAVIGSRKEVEFLLESQPEGSATPIHVIDVIPTSEKDKKRAIKDLVTKALQYKPERHQGLTEESNDVQVQEQS